MYRVYSVQYLTLYDPTPTPPLRAEGGGGYFRARTMEPIFSVVVWFLPRYTNVLSESWEIIDTYLVLNNR